ncbi:MAG: transporter [Firmicutes bacterium]|nr:transporter [Bacillota bacterium]
MTQVLLKAMAFVCIIILGYMLKRIGLFMPNDYKIISKIVMNLTLPAAVITGFANFQMDISLIYVVLLGFLCNVVMVSLGFWAGANNDDTKAFYMLNFSGYNIGCFTLPFVQNFLGPFGVVATCMFDSGNSIMCTGGTYAAAASVVGVGEKGHGIRLIKTLFSSVPFTTYMVVLLLSLLGIHLPAAVSNLASVIAGANSFLAMLMIGMMIKIDLEPRYLKQAAFILSIRYLLAAIFAVIFYFYTPFTLEVRQVLALVIFAPISALVPVFTEKFKGNTALASFTNSISIVLSITIMTILLVVMKVG